MLWMAAWLSAAAPDGAALMRRFECARCHDGTGLASPPRRKHCVHCHRDIVEGHFAAPSAALARWQGHLVNLLHVPSLAGAGATLRRDWVRAFLLRPRDLRPALGATMPRLDLQPAEADAIAEQLVPREAPPARFTEEEREAGRGMYQKLRCSSCHFFTGAPVEQPSGVRIPASAAIALAPDLARTRERFQSGALAGFLIDPSRASPDARMPRFPLRPADARALAAFILDTPLAPVRPAALPPRLAPLGRRLSFDEVSARVFRRTCWHCHSSPDYARGDGGPGNTGGFGFRGRGLDLSSYAGVMAGSLGDDGRRRGLLAPTADGTPLLLAVLRARQVEEAGGTVERVRGMPLGLPALSAEELQLVETWVAQGRPR